MSALIVAQKVALATPTGLSSGPSCSPDLARRSWCEPNLRRPRELRHRGAGKRGFRVFPREYAAVSGLPARGRRTAPISGVYCQTRRFRVSPQNLRRSWTYFLYEYKALGRARAPARARARAPGAMRFDATGGTRHQNQR